MTKEERREMRTTIGEAKARPAPHDAESLAEVLPGEMPRRDLFDDETLRKIRMTPEGGRWDERTKDELERKYPRSSWLWPPIWDADSARSAAAQGAASAFLIGVVTLIIGELNAADVELMAELEVDPVGAVVWSTIFFLIAWGIHLMSRGAAVLGLMLYLFGRVALWTQLGPRRRIGILSLWILLTFVHAVRGTFAYREMISSSRSQRSSATKASPHA